MVALLTTLNVRMCTVPIRVRLHCHIIILSFNINVFVLLFPSARKTQFSCLIFFKALISYWIKMNADIGTAVRNELEYFQCLITDY